jgi:hypothetical protein
LRRGLAAPAVALALFLLPLLPAPSAYAAEYEMETVAGYGVDPAGGEVAVSVAVTFTNTLPDPPGKVSAFTHVDLAIHEGASDVAASDDAGPLHVDLETRDGAQVASVRTRSRVRYERSVSFTLSYRLADAAAPGLYVREGIVKFPAWGFGTSSQVTVELPGGYEVRADGDPMVIDTAGPGIRLTSGPIADPGAWLALVTAVRPGDFVTRSASVPLASGTVDLQVRAWSIDAAWGDRTLALLGEALPLLEEAIGLPYPRVGPLVVSEAAAGESGAGGAPSATTELQAAFDGSDYALLHQAAHIWIGRELAQDRWILEGLASHMAGRVAAELEVEIPYDPAARSGALAADAQPLIDWTASTVGGAADAYGYAASWDLVNRIAAVVGEARLKAALARVLAGLSGYDPVEPGALPIDGRPYTPVDTRRFLDELAAVSGGDVSGLFGEKVFRPDAAGELAERKSARAAYTALLGHAGDWGAPDPVRRAMSEWRFGDARVGIEAASAFLAGRDEMIAAADAVGLVPPERLRERYAGWSDDADAAAELAAERAMVDAFTSLKDRAAAPRGPLDAVGLMLAPDPKALLAEAAGSFGAGDLRGMAEALDRLELTLNRAPADGAVRLAGAAVVIVLLGLGTGVALRRRSGSHYTAGP